MSLNIRNGLELASAIESYTDSVVGKGGEEAQKQYDEYCSQYNRLGLAGQKSEEAKTARVALAFLRAVIEEGDRSSSPSVSLKGKYQNLALDGPDMELGVSGLGSLALSYILSASTTCMSTAVCASAASSAWLVGAGALTLLAGKKVKDFLWPVPDSEVVRDIPSERVVGTISQFETHKGSAASACAVMSFVALERMRAADLRDQEDIDTILAVGSDLYDRIIDRIADSLIERRENGEAGVIGDLFSGLDRSVPAIDASLERKDRVKVVSRALHGMYLNWTEIRTFLPLVRGHELSEAVEQYDVFAEVTEQLRGDRSDKSYYEDLIRHLTFGLTDEEHPHYGLLTLGGETYAVRAFIDKGQVFIDFVNTHGEEQLESKAAKRTFAKDAFIEELQSRHTRDVSSKSVNHNQIGIVVMKKKTI